MKLKFKKIEIGKSLLNKHTMIFYHAKINSRRTFVGLLAERYTEIVKKL